MVEIDCKEYNGKRWEGRVTESLSECIFIRSRIVVTISSGERLYVDHTCRHARPGDVVLAWSIEDGFPELAVMPAEGAIGE